MRVGVRLLLQCGKNNGGIRRFDVVHFSTTRAYPRVSIVLSPRIRPEPVEKEP